MAAHIDRESNMHRLISAAIVVICGVGVGTPAHAASHMGAHPAAAPVHIGSPHPFAAPHMGPHQMSMSAHIDRTRQDRGERHRHGGRDRNGFPLEPFGYFDSAVGPDEIGASPAEPFIDPPSFVPPIPAAELPPCRETGAGGVVVLRGTGCTR